ncbi:MAG: hypothetical protein EA409_04135 [Saprospirales bacterium]|nr:MAG: hypothetical protein EA409_04135 [Saprospirales bacterium]
MGISFALFVGFDKLSRKAYQISFRGNAKPEMSICSIRLGKYFLGARIQFITPSCISCIEQPLSLSKNLIRPLFFSTS